MVRKNNRRRRNVKVAGENVSPVRFHHLVTLTLSGSTGVSTVPMTPDNANIGGLDNVKNEFDLFRFTKLRYRIHPMNPADTVNQVASYYPDPDLQVVTSPQNSESPHAAVQTPFCGVPSRWIKVPRIVLKGMIDWYKCNPDSGAIEFESQGTITCSGGLSDSFNLEIEGTCEFKNPVSSAIMMERIIDSAVKKGLVSRITPEKVEEELRKKFIFLPTDGLDVEQIDRVREKWAKTPTPTFCA